MAMLGLQLRQAGSSNPTVTAIVIIAIFLGLVYHRVTAWDRFQTQPPRNKWPVHRPQMTFQSATKSEKKLLDFYFEHILQPTTSVNAPIYRPWGATSWIQSSNVFFTSPLGQKLCIIDLDDRKFNHSGQIFGPDSMSWKDMNRVHGLSLGILNHWLYAKIHKYKYYYVDVQTPQDRRASWKKPSVISRILQIHDVCVYIDSDAVFMNLDLPFEWLMNYWELNPAANSLSLAADPNRDYNKDEKGNINLNTGFIVAENNYKSHEIMSAWSRCPDDGGRYPGCEKYRLSEPGRPTDQEGFGSYVRYDYKSDIKELPCSEANGFPEARAGCDGIFIRHFWTGKDDMIKVVVGNQMPGPYLELFHREFRATRNSFYMTEAQLMR